MKCLILAAGYATRLYPLTENFPKPLLKVGEKSILDWLVDDLVDTTDIDEFVVISNHKFAQHFEDWKSNKQKTRPYEITVIDDGTSTNETRLGAVKDIQLAVEKLNFADDLLVMAGDNVLDFSLSKFVEFAKEKDTSCVMCHVENELKKQQKTAIITLDGNDLITSYEEKPKEPKGNLAVPPFYCYRACDVKRIQEALDNGCGYDAPGSFAAWLSKQTPMHAYVMPGKRYDIGDINSAEICGIPVIGGLADLPELKKEYSLLVVGIGNNQFRAQVYEKAKSLGYAFPNIIAPSAYVSPFAEVGCGCVVLQNACIQNGASVGSGVLLNAGTEVHCDATIGDYALIYTSSVIRTGATVGKFARIGSNCTICNNATVLDSADVSDCTAVH